MRLAPSRRRGAGPAVVRGRGRSRHLLPGRLRCAPDRELALGTRRRDTRPARGLGRLDQRAGDHPDPALPRRRRQAPTGRDSGRALPPCGARPVPEAARVSPERDRDRRRDDRRCSCVRRGAARSDRGRDRQRAGGGAERAGRPRDGRRRPPGRVHPVRRDLEPHRAGTAGRTGGSRSPSRPITSRARSTAQSSPSPATPWISSSSRPARFRRHPGATASTPSSPAIHTTRTWPRRSPRFAASPSASPSSAPTRLERPQGLLRHTALAEARGEAGRRGRRLLHDEPGRARAALRGAEGRRSIRPTGCGSPGRRRPPGSRTT